MTDERCTGLCSHAVALTQEVYFLRWTQPIYRLAEEFSHRGHHRGVPIRLAEKHAAIGEVCNVDDPVTGSDYDLDRWPAISDRGGKL